MKRPAVPTELAPLVELVQQYVQTCPIIGSFPVMRGASTPNLTGHCANAASLFWYMVGGAKTGWKNMRLPGTLDARRKPKAPRRSLWKYGPHAFVLHEPSGTVVDPTEGQFPASIAIPYGRAEGGTSGGFRKNASGQTVPPTKVLLAAQDLWTDPWAKDAVLRAMEWSRGGWDGRRGR